MGADRDDTGTGSPRGRFTVKSADVEKGRRENTPESRTGSRLGSAVEKAKTIVKKRKKGGGEKQTGGIKDLSSLFTEHTWEVDRVADHYRDSNIDSTKPEQSEGLSLHRARDLLAENGPNKLPEQKDISNLRLFLNQFLNMFWILLGGVAGLNLLDFFAARQATGGATSLYVSIIIFTMIIVMCYISYYQEREARKVVAGFQNLLPPQCVVIRDGAESTIQAEELVVGDVIRIKSGMKLPADARVLSCNQLKLETSSITGESEPVEYQSEAVPSTVNIFESRNVAFNGSFCVDGEGVGVVIRCGADTAIGHIAALTTEQKQGHESHLEKEIRHFVQFLTVFTIAVGLSAFVAGGFVNHWHHVALMLATSFSVCVLGMIPEGMPATVTSCLTLVARRMAKRNVYLKKLDIVEALGCANIIASDKTGTLTKNVMTVTDVWYCNEYVTDLPEQYRERRTRDAKTISRVLSPLNDLLVAMTICNTASFEEPQLPAITAGDSKMSRRLQSASRRRASVDPREMSRSTRHKHLTEQVQGRKAVGTPSEVALIKYAEQFVNVHKFRKQYDIVFEIPFNSKRKYHVVISKIRDSPDQPDHHEYLLLMKGAPEIIIQHCSTILTTDEEDAEVELTDDRRADFERAYNTYGEQGRRVIGFAHCTFTAPADARFDKEEENFPLQQLVFIGVCAIMDPPRDETERAIRECKEAGIKVFMVTGDHHITATAIAKQIRLIDDKDDPNGASDDWEIVKGEMIPRLTKQDWDRLVTRRSLVFARTTPEQKLQIVEECQKRNQIIAMTGDGVNDAPALKRANIGVGMGSGSDVAKQAADIVLTDDNFSSIVGAVEEGRLMFDNIKKLMMYVLSHAFPQVWGILIHFCMGMPPGITTMIILTVDLGTEIPPGIAMCKEPLEGDVMKRPPRKAKSNLVSKAMLFYSYGYIGQLRAFTSFIAYMTVFWWYGIGFSDLWMSSLTHFRPEAEGGQVLFAGGRNFTTTEQIYINRQAISAWQVGIVFGQMLHVFSCRTLRQSLPAQGFFTNMYTIYSVFIELFFLLLFVYCPGVNDFLGGAPCPWIVWVVVFLFGVLVHAINELRKWCARRWPNDPVVRWFKF